MIFVFDINVNGFYYKKCINIIFVSRLFARAHKIEVDTPKRSPVYLVSWACL
jgi:hypothetical protein